MKMIFLLVLISTSMGQAASLSKNSVLVINANQAMIQCRDEYKKMGKPEGKVLVDFTIDKVGEVVEFGIDDKKSTIHDEKLHACIMKSLPARFPSDANGKIQILTATLNFPLKY